MAAMSQLESAPKLAARPQPEPPPARAASSPATSSTRVATTPVCLSMPQPPGVMKATPRSLAPMDDTSEFSVVMDIKPEVPVISSVVFGDNKAFSGCLRLASSLADPPLRSMRAAGIPRPSAVEVLEVVPLSASAVLPVMAVAMLCVWAVHWTLTPEPSPVQFSGPKPSQVQESVLEPSPVQESVSGVKSSSSFCSWTKSSPKIHSGTKSSSSLWSWAESSSRIHFQFKALNDQDGAVHGSRVASSYQTLQFFMCLTYYFAVFCTGYLHSYLLWQTHTFRNPLLGRTSETRLWVP